MDFKKLFPIRNNKDYVSENNGIYKDVFKYKASRSRKVMVDGERYYVGEHDILFKNRMVIGNDGNLEVVSNLPNNKIIDNQYKKMVDQKCNYLLGKPIIFNSVNHVYSNEIKGILNKSFVKTLKNIGVDSLNCGIGWLYIYYNEFGKLCFKRFKPQEILPVWKDDEHSELEYALRFFEASEDGKTIEIVEKYTKDGVSKYKFDNSGNLIGEVFVSSYSNFDTDEFLGDFSWGKVPLVPFKYNDREVPLIKMIKSLQDGINTIISKFQDHLEEDARNTILVLINYDGENLGEFRKNLSTYGAVKIRNDGNNGGDLKTLQVEVNAENYKTILEIMKKALVENAMGFDAKNIGSFGTPNQINIKSMYSDIELDANSMEIEYQASFEQLLWFINIHLFNMGKGDFDGEEYEIIFNRDMLMNESDIISDIKNSVGILSNRTLIAQHPYINDVEKELYNMELEKG